MVREQPVKIDMSLSAEIARECAGLPYGVPERQEMRPHNYFPSPMHQGDCGVCGRPGDHVIHTRSKP